MSPGSEIRLNGEAGHKILEGRRSPEWTPYTGSLMSPWWTLHVLPEREGHARLGQALERDRDLLPVH
jgi:hypothetical protein